MVKIEWNGLIIDVGPLDGRPSSVGGELLGVRAARLYVTVESRTAWHNTTSRQYDGESALYPYISLAKHHAEDQRKSGSQFIIRETPGLIFFSSQAVVFMVDFHPPVPFGMWDVDCTETALRLGTPMRQVIQAFTSPKFWLISSNTREDSLIHTTMRLDRWLDPDLWAQFDFVEPGATFRSLTSQAVGSGKELDWAKTDARYVADSVLAIEQAFVVTKRTRSG